jgi:uncharacterized PurR-regulated membrane protein YhhQ (DUF165 family)
VRYLPLVGYIATIVAANFAIQQWGVVGVGFGLMAPAGVFFAGLAFTLRDLVQAQLGRAWTVAAILLGAGVSAFVSPQFALASGVAFLISELCDFAVYTPIRERHWLTAVTLSNTVGLVVDSALFLVLAFGSLDFLAGQIVAKSYVTLISVACLWAWRRHREEAEYATAV